MTLTVETLKAAWAALKANDDRDRPQYFGPTRIVESHYALADSEERTFPPSRHRSKRVHKKLVKRFGGEFKKVPTIWRVGSTYYAHPSLYKKLRDELRLQPEPETLPKIIFSSDSSMVRFS